MNLNELLNMGASIFKESPLSGDAGSNLDVESIMAALSGLIGEGNSLNIPDLIQKFQDGGLQQLASSWLGDGENLSISPDQITNIFGADKLSEFASTLGMSQTEATGGLSEALPAMIDKASSGGSLLDSIGGVEGAIGFAKKLFG